MGPLYQNKSAGFIASPDDPMQHNIINPEATVFILQGASGNNHYTPNPCILPFFL